MSHHGPDPGPEGAAAEAGCPHHGGEDLGGVDVADSEGVDGGHSARQVQNQDGPLVCKLFRGNGLERCKIFEYSCVSSSFSGKICNSLHLSKGDEVSEAEAGPGHGVEEDESDAAAGLQQQEDHQRDRGELQQLQQALFIETIPR